MFTIINFTLDEISEKMIKKLLTVKPNLNQGIPEIGLYPITLAVKLEEVAFEVISILTDYSKTEVL